jgi:hypothetical protein
MEVTYMFETPEVVTRATWRPGLPPPIEAIQERFRPEEGWTVEYCWWIEVADDEPKGWRQIPIAVVRGSQGGKPHDLTFFPDSSVPAPDARRRLGICD